MLWFKRYLDSREVNVKLRSLLALCLTAVACIASAAAPASYSGQENREIKSMSAEDVQSYLAGKGMGLAKAAELNGYPGPSHVLSLAPDLGLTAEQHRLTQALFESMQADAIKFGRLLVEAERKLDQAFATKKIDPESLNASLEQIGALQAKVRAVHLQVHLAQARILTPQQNARYMELRGYSANQPAATNEHRHH